MNVFDITAIENSVRDIIRSLKISDTIYPNRPKASSASTLDFVVVRVTGGIVDKGAYGEATIAIDLFAKDINNVKNGKKLSLMYQKLILGLPTTKGNILFDNTPRVIGDVPDDYGYHARMINVKSLIKVQ